jgi:hypothetical protein
MEKNSRGIHGLNLQNIGFFFLIIVVEPKDRVFKAKTINKIDSQRQVVYMHIFDVILLS